MSLMNEQSIFLTDVCRLLEFAHKEGFLITGGELYRTVEQQALYEKQGKSKAGKWKPHCNRLAIDLNFFKIVNGKPVLTYDKKDLQKVGNYWCSLDKINTWGGNWNRLVDTPHFERTVGKK